MEMENKSIIEAECCPDFAEIGLCVKEEVNEALNDTEMSNGCVETRETEVVLDNMQLDSLRVEKNGSVLVVHSEMQETEVVLDNMQLDNVGPVRVTKIELSSAMKNRVDSLAELGSCTENETGVMNNSSELEHSAESLKNESWTSHCDNELRKKAAKESALKDVTIDIKLECSDKELKDVTGDGEMKPRCVSEVFTNTNEVKETVSRSGIGLEPSPKHKSKEASNDDIHSEVLNPNASPKHVTSAVTISSQAVDRSGIDPAACGEITSAYCQNSSSSGSLAEEEHHQLRDHKMNEPAATSRVILEIPKDVSTTGVRKITFKFSKRNEDCSNNNPVAVNPNTDYMHGQFYENPVSMSSSYSVSGNGFHNHEGGYYENAEMNVGIYRSALHGAQSSLSCFGNMELNMSKKTVPDKFPNNVKKLLATKILEGALVKYKSKSGEKEIPGIVKDGGYLCGCHACNFSTNVVSAYEFECHAGTKTRHPNNHVYLENGKRIYSIIEELKTATISTVDEVIKGVAGSSVNEEYFQLWKASIQCGTGLACANGVHQSQQQCGVYPSSFSHPIQPNEDSLYPTSLYYSRSIPFDQQCYQKAPVERKHLTKKARYHFPSSGGSKKRDNDLHKLLFMPNGLPDGTELGYYAKGKKVLGGYKLGHGIVCSCCYTEISPSQFESHAGWSAKRQPYRHIYTSSGLALHEIAVMLANGQNIITSGHDDMCAVCGDASELILCSGCPRAFHAGCLGLQYHPTNDWHCPHCSDKFGLGRKASGESRPLIVRFTRVVKTPEYEPGGCVLCRSQEFSAANFDDKTVIICDQCEKEYHVGCLRESDMCDLKELPEDKWFCCDACTKIFTTLQTLASGGPEVIPASVSAALYNKHSFATGQSGVFESEVNWQVLSGKSRSPDHLFLLSRAAEIFRECFDPIVAASGRDLIPVMVYGRNISGQEFSGMYCVVLTVKNIVVSAALLRIFGLDAAELPLVATGRENQGRGYFRALFSCIERFLLSMGVKTLVLPAAEDAEPMWTKKLGFRKTSNEQMLRYTRDLQLTIFMGTSLLSKEVQQCSLEKRF